MSVCRVIAVNFGGKRLGADYIIEIVDLAIGQFKSDRFERVLNLLWVSSGGNRKQIAILCKLPSKRDTLVGAAVIVGDFLESVEQMLIEGIEKATKRRPADESQSKLFAGFHRVVGIAVDRRELVLDGDQSVSQNGMGNLMSLLSMREMPTALTTPSSTSCLSAPIWSS